MSLIEQELEALRAFAPTNWGRQDKLAASQRVARDEEAAKLIRLSAQFVQALPAEGVEELRRRAVVLTEETTERTPFDQARLRAFDALVRPTLREPSRRQTTVRAEWGKDFCKYASSEIFTYAL